MKTVKFWDIPNTIKNLTFDGDKSDMRLHNDSDFNWGAKTKKDYQKAIKLIDKISYKGNGWQLYAWYDVSSYEYWMKQQQEQNYITISVSFDNEDIQESEIKEIDNAIIAAEIEAGQIADNYNYNPMDLANLTND